MWLGTSLLREYRGDGHIAALTGAKLSGIEALITFVATGRSFTPAMAQSSRGWTDEQWADAIDDLRCRGFADGDGPELALTPAGTQLRDDVEAVTNRLARPPWRQLGDAGTETLRRIVTDLSWLIVDAGTIDSRNFADVCLHAEDAVLVAALARALVETEARAAREGHAAPPTRTELLRLAAWRASRSGLDDDLLNPVTGLPEQAATVARLLVDHCRDALDDAGDTDAVQEMLRILLARGNGAAFQRTAFRRSGRLADVVNSAVAATGTDRWVG
jgi:hypothetical protein